MSTLLYGAEEYGPEESVRIQVVSFSFALLIHVLLWCCYNGPLLNLVDVSAVRPGLHQ